MGGGPCILIATQVSFHRVGCGHSESSCTRTSSPHPGPDLEGVVYPRLPYLARH
ncbi:hypothetical protein FIBSPDRAFT_286929 [Athelia psychrophila]|uniref:Uncharacterized protein n=1 Tax=Athelia psychrophila TaxID=1759441 RepID=A0A167XRQ3_9AGAM|nr:hypothetical protein FIBSPDRAFT_286929 [Fibularhizoctonia sp. CBS 109695]